MRNHNLIFFLFPSFIVCFSILIYSLLSYQLYRDQFLFFSIFSFLVIYLTYLMAFQSNINFLETSQKNDKNSYLILIMLLSSSTMILYQFLAGFPAFSLINDEAKLQVSNYPILVRFYRILGLIPVIYFLVTRDEKLKNIVISYVWIMVILGFLTAFRGYAIPYLISLMAIYYDKNFKSSFLIYGFIFIAAFIMFLSFIEGGMDIFSVLELIFIRVTEVQLIGTTQLIESSNNIDYLPILDEFNTLFSKLFSNGGLSLQQYLYQIVHDGDKNFLEVANFFIAEIIIFYGNLGFVIFLFFFFSFIYIFSNFKFTALSISFCFVVFLGMVDGLINGKMIFRVTEYIFFLTFCHVLISLFNLFLKRSNIIIKS